MKPFSILHISDLHRSPKDPITNDELISALVSDRDRYVREDLSIPAPEAIVVSGDIIQGVPIATNDFAKEIDDQYAVAEEFLDELVRRFLEGDRSRLIMVPGNHDIDWNTALSALAPVEEKSIPPRLGAALHSENSDLRWDWATRTLYRIADPALYERRLEAFWKFFTRFYEGVTGLLDVQEGADACLFSLCDDRIGVAAYNSCHGNDCFAFHGMIRKETIARSHLDLDDSGKVFDLRMAVWHHSIDGPPYRTDYMDVDIVRGMIGRGFRLGLYGHQHKTQVTPHEVFLPDHDCFAFHGMIRKETIARSHLDLDDSGKVFDLRMAVWHHSIDGPPYRTDYMDVDIVRGMIGRGFRLGLYGHQHKTQVTPHEVFLPDRERMAVISAGSLCAGASELPTGVHRQYNVLEFAEDFSRVRVHVRAMIVANLFSRGRFIDFGDASYADLDWAPPRSAVGSVVDTKAQRVRALIDEAELAAKTGKPDKAISILGSLELPSGSYERQLFLIAATDAQDWTAIVKVTDPPATIDELVQRFEAFSRLGDLDGAIDTLDRFSQQLQLPEPMVAEFRRRVSAQEAMKQ